MNGRGTRSGTLEPTEVRLEPGHHMLDCVRAFVGRHWLRIWGKLQQGSVSRCKGQAFPAGGNTRPPVPILAIGRSQM